MRKHFLILMLLTLLPLAGWAITEVNVRAKVFEVEYGLANPENVDPAMLRLSIDDNANGDLAAAIAEKLKYTTDREASDVVSNETRTFTISLKLAGDDVVTVDLDDDNTVEEYAINITSATAAMKTKKATTGTGFAITGTPVFVAGDLSYTGNPQSLVTAESIAADAFYGTVNTLSHLPMEFSVDGGTTWADNAEVTNANTGGYTLNYRIKGYGVNFEADGAKADLGDNKAVAKATITLTAGTAAKDLTYDGQTHQLLTAPVTASAYNPTLVYFVDKKGAEEYPGTYNVFDAGITDYQDLVLTNAGKYKVKCDISDADKANLTVTNTGGVIVSDEIEIAKANAIVVAPAALKPSYTNAYQNLISAGTAITGATIKYCATNSDNDADWTTVIPQGKFATGHVEGGADPVAYTAWYKVAGDATNGNWDAVGPTQITGVTIEKAIVTVKVNNISKVYDGTVSLDAAIIDGTNPKFTFITLQTGDDAAAFNGVAYSAVEAVNANATPYVGVVTANAADFTAINDNYAYYVQPGNLTINKSQLTITALHTNAAFGSNEATADALADNYIIKDQNNNDVAAADAFEAEFFPVLTSSQAAAAEYKPGTYDVEFTEGTIKDGGNYEVAENGYVIAEATKFVIGKASQVIITVIPKEVQYGTAEDWTATPVQDVDYYVANLLPGDEITAISLTREGAGTEFGVAPYALTATATIAHPEWYANDGAIIFNNSTFTIKQRELTATIDQQTIVVNVPGTFVNTKWDVTPMQFDQNKSVLNATLALAEGAATSTGPKAQGIVLTINNPNYKLVGDNVIEGKAYGTLIVIAANTMALQSTDVDLLAKLQTAQTNGSNYTVTFEGDNRVMKAKEWYAMVLPFDTTPLELAKNLNTYVVVNVLKSSKIEYVSGTGHNRDEAIVNFGLEMDAIPAGTPFIIKPAAETKWNTTENLTNTYSARKVYATLQPTVTTAATYTATYETGKSLQWGYELDGTTENADMKYRWLANTTDLQAGSTTEYRDNAWYNCMSNAHALEPMEAFLILDPDAQGARIFVEDFENGTTAIKSLNADQVNGLKVAEGWYTINGVKLQSMPTEKGIYINNGKKVVIK